MNKKVGQNIICGKTISLAHSNHQHVRERACSYYMDALLDQTHYCQGGNY